MGKAGKLTHIGAGGEARMVDVSAKPATERVAVAEGRVAMTKETHELIPLCHPLPVSKVEIDITPAQNPPGLAVRASVKVTGQTGVEMEALTAVAVACLTIYDMVKAAERGMRIEAIRLVEKRGGKSGHFRANGE